MHGGRATLHMCCVPLGLGRINTEGFSVQRRRRHGTSSAGKADKGMRSRDVAMEGGWGLIKVASVMMNYFAVSKVVKVRVGSHVVVAHI